MTESAKGMPVITEQWLNEHRACSGGMSWWMKHKQSDFMKLARALVRGKHYRWCAWLIARVLPRKERILWACYCAEQVLDKYEKKYPKDDRPRKAIEAARKVAENDTAENRAAAANTSYVVHAAYAYAAAAAANTSHDAYAVACTAEAAAYTYAYAAVAYAAARASMYVKMLKEGIRMMEEYYGR